MDLTKYHDGQPVSLMIGLSIWLPLHHHANNKYFKLLPWKLKVRLCPECTHPLRFHTWNTKEKKVEMQQEELYSDGCIGMERTKREQRHCKCSGWIERV